MMNALKKYSAVSVGGLKTVGASVVVASLVLLSATVLSVEESYAAKSPQDVGYDLGEWEVVDEGFISRRKEPKRAKQAKVEKEKKASLKEAKKAKKAKLSKAEKAELKAAAKAESALSAKAESELAAFSEPVIDDETWVRTEGEGMVEVSVEDLASVLGMKPKDLEKKLKKGELQITNAGQPRKWLFEKKEGLILFPAEAFETFNTSENAFLLEQRKTAKGEAEFTMDEEKEDKKLGEGQASAFMDTLHFEEEPDWMIAQWVVRNEPEADYWFWNYLNKGQPSIDIDLVAPSPQAFGTATIAVGLRGRTNLGAGDDHHVEAYLNSNYIGSVTWDGLTGAELLVDFDQAFLDPAGDNVLTLEGSAPNGASSSQYLDDITLSYWRSPQMLDGELWLHQPAAGVQKVTGLASDEVYIVRDPLGAATLIEKPRFDSGPGGIEVSFTADGVSDYLVVEPGSTMVGAPESDPGSNLAALGNSAFYVIITPDEFAGTAEALAAHRQPSFGSVKVVRLQDIYDEFSAGRVDPKAITQFANTALNWAGKPEYIVLLGRGTLDHKDRMGYGDSLLPTVWTTTPWALTASDDALLGGNGDAPYVFGRIPIVSDAEGIDYVNKLKLHEQGPPPATREALLIADNPDSAGDFHANSDTLADHLLNDLGMDAVHKLYHPDDPVRASLLIDATWNKSIVSYDGHGSTTQAGNGSEKFVNSVDAAALNNTQYPVFSALTCSVANFVLPGYRSLAAALVLNSAGGVSSSMGPTGLSLDTDAQVLGTAYFDSLVGTNVTVGEALKQAKADSAGKLNDFMLRMYGIIGEPAVYMQ